MNNFGKSIRLKNGIEIPRLGLGVWKIDNSEVNRAVVWALKSGYRHIDTASVYKNEKGVGLGIRESGLSRADIFVTTKLSVFDFIRPETAFYQSLSRLGMDYVDLYLLHWPFFGWKNAWKTLEKIYKAGKARSIGVSNFGIKQLESLKKICEIGPMVNQVELSPFLNRAGLVDYCHSEKIVVEAYSPLTRAKRLKDQRLTVIADKYGKTSAQIMIRWGLQHNFVVLPKSETKDHIENNAAVFDFKLAEKDMQKLDDMNENYSALLPGWSRKD